MNKRPYKFDRAQTSTPQIDIEVRRACGHIETVKSFTKDTNTPWFASQEQRDCRECYTQKSTAVDDRAVAGGKRVALRGTDKQIDWAKALRQKRALSFATIWNDVIEQGKKVIDQKRYAQTDVDAGVEALRVAIMELMMGKTEWYVDDKSDDTFTSADARWWIECRTMTDRQMLEVLCDTRDVGAMPDPKDWSGLFVSRSVDDSEPVATTDTVDADEFELDTSPF